MAGKCDRCRKVIPEGAPFGGFPDVLCEACVSLEARIQAIPTKRHRTVTVTCENPELAGTYYHADDHPLRDRAPKYTTAVTFLESLGYTWHDGAWRPPGKGPAGSFYAHQGFLEGEERGAHRRYPLGYQGQEY